jgi:hypothetical protein
MKDQDFSTVPIRRKLFFTVFPQKGSIPPAKFKRAQTVQLNDKTTQIYSALQHRRLRDL